MAYRLRVLSSVMFVSVSLFALFLRDWDIHLATHLGTDARTKKKKKKKKKNNNNNNK